MRDSAPTWWRMQALQLDIFLILNEKGSGDGVFGEKLEIILAGDYQPLTWCAGVHAHKGRA